MAVLLSNFERMKGWTNLRLVSEADLHNWVGGADFPGAPGDDAGIEDPPVDDPGETEIAGDPTGDEFFEGPTTEAPDESVEEVAEEVVVEDPFVEDPIEDVSGC